MRLHSSHGRQLIETNRVEGRNTAQQSDRIGMAGVLLEGRRRVLLDNATFVHDDDAIGIFAARKAMSWLTMRIVVPRSLPSSNSSSINCATSRHQLRYCLVCNQELGLGAERDSNHDTLLHSAGQFIGARP